MTSSTASKNTAITALLGIILSFIIIGRVSTRIRVGIGIEIAHGLKS